MSLVGIASLQFLEGLNGVIRKINKFLTSIFYFLQPLWLFQLLCLWDGVKWTSLNLNFLWVNNLPTFIFYCAKPQQVVYRRLLQIFCPRDGVSGPFLHFWEDLKNNLRTYIFYFAKPLCSRHTPPRLPYAPALARFKAAKSVARSAAPPLPPLLKQGKRAPLKATPLLSCE